MPRRPRVFVDGTIYHGCVWAGAAGAVEGALEADPRRVRWGSWRSDRRPPMAGAVAGAPPSAGMPRARVAPTLLGSPRRDRAPAGCGRAGRGGVLPDHDVVAGRGVGPLESHQPVARSCWVAQG